jgi:hypothetical protein
MARRRISQFDGITKADERTGYMLEDALARARASADDDTQGGGGGVDYPIPYFGAGGTDYWQMDAIRDDDDTGKTVTMYWLIPAETYRLEVTYRYLKKDGTAYNKKRRWRTADISDDDRMNGLLEWTQDGLKPNRKLDIIQARAFLGKRRSEDQAANPPEGGTVQTVPAAGNDTLIAGSPYDGQGGYGSSGAGLGAALARIVSGEYLLAEPRITAIGAAEKEEDGVYWPITFTYNANTCRTLAVWYRRCGKKNSVTGVSTSTTYGRIKRKKFEDLTEAEQTAGTCIRYIGPFIERQARKTWHIVRIRATSYLNDDAPRRIKEFYPILDADLSTAANDTSPANSAAPIPGRDASFGSGTPENPNGVSAAAMLAILSQVEDVNGSIPSSGFSIDTAPDLATEKDGDAYIRWQGTIKGPDGVTTITAAEANATEAVFVFMTKKAFDDFGNDPKYYKRDRAQLEPTDQTVGGEKHRKIGRRLKLIKVVLRNALSRVATDLTSFTGGPVVSGLFVAGHTTGGYVETDANLYLNTVQCIQLDSGESNKAHFNASMNNAGFGGVIPVIPKTIEVFVSKKGQTTDPGALPAAGTTPTAGSGWRLAKTIKTKDEPELATLGTVTRQFQIAMRRKKAHFIKLRVWVAGSATPVDQTTSTSYTTTSELPNDNYAHGNQNMVTGGAFLFSRQDFDTANNPDSGKLGKQWRTSPSRASVVNYIDDTTSNPRWDKPNHALRFIGIGTFTGYTLIGKALQPGDTLAFSCLLSISGLTDVNVTVEVGHDNNDSGSFVSISSAAAVLNPAINLFFRMYGDTITISGTPTIPAGSKMWLKITVTNIGVGGYTGMDNVMLARGSQILTYDYSATDLSVTNDTGSSSALTPVGTGPGQFDLGGGGKNPDLNAATGEITL